MKCMFCMGEGDIRYVNIFTDMLLNVGGSVFLKIKMKPNTHIPG